MALIQNPIVKKALAAFLVASSLSGCTSMQATMPNGAMVEETQTIFGGSSRVTGFDKNTVNANQITALERSNNTYAREIARMAKQEATNSENDVISDRERIEKARRDAQQQKRLRP